MVAGSEIWCRDQGPISCLFSCAERDVQFACRAGWVGEGGLFSRSIYRARCGARTWALSMKGDVNDIPMGY